MSIWLQFDIMDYLVNQLRLTHNYRAILLVSEIDSEVIGDISLIFNINFRFSQIFDGFVYFCLVWVQEHAIIGIQEGN